MSVFGLVHGGGLGAWCWDRVTAALQAHIAAMPGWKRDLGKRLDALIVRNV
jgi:hypothetical protein